MISIPGPSAGRRGLLIRSARSAILCARGTPQTAHKRLLWYRQICCRCMRVRLQLATRAGPLSRDSLSTFALQVTEVLASALQISPAAAVYPPGSRH